jgi:pimeloyl-ACP methyl ester carboxylesterase/DNA-binding CsgD family transcriptional regulator
MAPHSEQIRFCTSRDGTRIAYGVSGDGPPLVWSSPWVHHIKSDWDSPVWRPWLRKLTQGHTLIRYDWRGCGLSDHDQIQFSFEKNIEDLSAVIEATGFDTFACLGNVGGGIISLAYAVRNPRRVTHLILNGCSMRGRLARANSREQIEEAQTRLKVFEIGWNSETPAFAYFITALHLPEGTAEEIRSYNELIRQVTTPANLNGLLRSFWEADVRDIVQEVRCPTLVLHSRHDALIPFEEGRLLASQISGARFVPLDSRHNVLLEHEPAWHQFAAALDDFLPGVSATLAEGVFIDALTARENEVLELVAQGVGNEAIARKLGTRGKTVRNQVSTIFSKLGVTSRAQAIVRARDAGFGRKASGRQP